MSGRHRPTPPASPGPRPLNPTLYGLLVARFGRVLIANEGERAVLGEPRFVPQHGRCESTTTSAGEYYRARCFAPETRVVTPAGDALICDLVGTATLLIPNEKGLGNWKQVEVRPFGVQSLRTVTLRRRRSVKTIRATPDHRWVLSGRLGLYSYATTEQLRPGARLASCFARKLTAYGQYAPRVSAVGVAQGFVFGDGSKERKGNRPASVRMYGAKAASLRPYFGVARCVDVEVYGETVPQVCDLPRSWKELPAHDEALSFLLGWFAGYFSADGHVNKAGNQATLYSAFPAHLHFVKGICYQLGIRVGRIRPRQRTSEGCVPGAMDMPLYGMAFPVRDVPPEFWILAKHRKRALAWLAGATGGQASYWVVESVEDKGESDSVYCAVVPGAEKFTLADNILTMNCPYCGDTRYRLYVNYLWGTPDPLTGRPMRHLAVCYNADCLKEHYRDFEDRLLGPISEAERAALATVTLADAALAAPARAAAPVVVAPPGAITPLDRLPRDHAAVRYLEGRGFDVAALAAEHGVGFCAAAPPPYSAAAGRIYVPIVQGGALASWQSRWPGDDWKARGVQKYYNLPGVRKSGLLYNRDRALDSPAVVVVEGVSDVWAAGPAAVALLGKTASIHQLGLLAAWSAGLCVLLLDGDAWAAAPKDVAAVRVRHDRLLYELRQLFAGRVVEVALPPGRDPGSFSRAVLDRLVRDRVTAAGFRPGKYHL